MTTEVIAGKYRIIREIARSNDVVYEAEDMTLDRRVAIKEILVPPSLTGAAKIERIERFRREARAAGRLCHPNIVTIHEHVEENDRSYIVMEYLAGMTLRERLDLSGAVPLADAVHIAKQVLSALAHAHANKVIHRDVKPENIHILPGEHIKLTDFGIARITEDVSLTADGQVFGTPSYMSPEQIEGRGIDHRTDIFSTAVVLYEMLSGRKPFTGDSVLSITHAIMTAEPEPLRGVPVAIENVIRQGLAKDPNRRFPSAEAMRQALEDAVAVSAQPRAVSYTSLPAALPPTAVPTSLPTGGVPAPQPGAVPVQPPPVYPTIVQPTVAPPPGAPLQGPFATWGPPAHSPAPLAAPARSGPILSEGALAFLRILIVSFLIAGIVLSGVLLFLRSYEEHQRAVAAGALVKRLEEGRRRFLAGDLQGAIAAYEEVLQKSPNSPEGLAARTSLATVLNHQGVDAARKGRYAEAVQRFQAVLELYRNYPSPLGADDLALQQQAADNLEAARSHLLAQGAAPGIPVAPGTPGPPAGALDPGAEMLAERELQARLLVEEAESLYRFGRVEAARERWQNAAVLAPGTKPALEAQQRLQETAPSPTFLR